MSDNSIIMVETTSFELELIFLIDKVDFNPNQLIPLTDLEEYWRSKLLFYHSYNSAENQSGIKCENIGFLFQPFSSTHIYKVISNPNDFDSYDDYIATIRKVLPSNILSRITISRLDIACDILNQEFSWVNQRLRIEFKHAIERFLNNSREETRVFGRYPEVIKLYDKRLQVQKKRKKRNLKHQSKEKWIRIEVSQKTKAKLPTNNIFELKDKLLEKDYNPFKSVYIKDFLFPGIEERKKREKQIKLRVLTETSGLQHARRVLSKHDNFNRDFGKLILPLSDLCIGKYYHEGISKCLEVK